MNSRDCLAVEIGTECPISIQKITILEQYVSFWIPKIPIFLDQNWNIYGIPISDPILISENNSKMFSETFYL